MPRVNDDLHSNGYVFQPTNAVTALFAPNTDMSAVGAVVLQAGYPDEAIFLLQGEQGSAQLDVHAKSQGFFTWLRRGVDEVLSDQVGVLEQADRVLKSGGGLAILTVGPDDAADPHKAKRAANLLAMHGGKELWYWGGLALERMSGEPLIA